MPTSEDKGLSGAFRRGEASGKVVELQSRESERPKLSGLRHEIEHLLKIGDIPSASFKCEILMQKILNHKSGEKCVLEHEVPDALADMADFVRKIAEQSPSEACSLVKNLWTRMQKSYVVLRDIKIAIYEMSLDVHMPHALQNGDYAPSAIKEIAEIMKFSALSYNAYPFGDIFDKASIQWAKLLYIASPKDRYEYAIDLHKWADRSMHDVACLENFVGQILVDATEDENGDQVILLDSEKTKRKTAGVTTLRALRLVPTTSPEIK